MPDLFHSLLKQDVGHLRIIAELWGLELESPKAEGALEELCASLLDPNLLAELIDSLPPEADSALTSLVHSGGRIPWAMFTRKYGDIREAGAGKRDREKLYRQPASATEVLYYRGLLGRAFFDTEKGPQEFAYVPDDLLELMKEERGKKKEEDLDVVSESLGRPASPGEKGREILADDSILDDATTMLAALRMSRSDWQSDLRLRDLLASAKLISPPLSGRETGHRTDCPIGRAEAGEGINADAVKAFLEASRKEALIMLREAWMTSKTFNELKLMPSLVCEGEWTNQPLETREFLLNLLDEIPAGKWWSLNAFVRDIKQKYADFQRPAGDYDSWFIKRASDGQYLRGFAYWDEVDGALIKYFITDILHWLGEVDLSIVEGTAEPTAFRVSSFTGEKEERGKVAITSGGKISIPRDAPRAVRYQVSRFCEWEDVSRVAKRTEAKDYEYRYRITTNSLTKAKEQGLKVEHLLALLAKYSDAGIPPALVKALKRWEVNGTEARVETQVVLRVTRPEILEEMRKSRAAKYLGEMLSPTAAIVKSGAIQKAMEVLMELGVMGEVEE
jgi:hypothetical protein